MLAVQYLPTSKQTEPRARGDTERPGLNWSAGNGLAACHDVGIRRLADNQLISDVT